MVIFFKSEFLLPLLFFLILIAYGCTYEQVKEYADKDINITEEQLEELVKEKAKVEYEKREPGQAACGNNVCEYYRLTTTEGERGWKWWRSGVC